MKTNQIRETHNVYENTFFYISLLDTLPSVTAFTTTESRPDFGTMAFPVLDLLPSTIMSKETKPISSKTGRNL